MLHGNQAIGGGSAAGGWWWYKGQCAASLAADCLLLLPPAALLNGASLGMGVMNRAQRGSSSTANPLGKMHGALWPIEPHLIYKATDKDTGVADSSRTHSVFNGA